MLKTGTVIAERYEIQAKIGTGGMADVYKAKDLKLNRFVAVKVLKPEFREDTTFIRKFKSEAQAAAGLTHPNIVNVFDVGEDEGVYYIVMELIEGITLKEYISKKGKLSIKEATSIAIQVSMGLEAAHSHGIVHRDVKPQNICISTDGKVKVTDFGIARAASSNTISSNVMGSVHYSSPEQVRGGYSDEKSDIYSLGITIYEMVTGKVPFDGDTTVAIAIKHLQEEMVPPSAYAPDIPFSLEQIIYKCTQKSVDRRYQKMEEVIADLKHSLIDPQGDFVKINEPDTEGKTRVITDEEVGAIKTTRSSVKNMLPKKIFQRKDLKEELESMDGTSLEDDEAEEEEEAAPAREKEPEQKKEIFRQKRRKLKKRRNISRAVPIALLILGAVFLVWLIMYIGRAAGLLGGDGNQNTGRIRTETAGNDQEDALVVPDLVGMTEAEAQEAANEVHLGIKFSGQEPSIQEKNRISRTVPSAGTPVQENSTVVYYLSTGSPDVTIPQELSNYRGIDAEQALKDMGLSVTVRKEYPELDDQGSALVEPGYVYYTEPAVGSQVKAGDNVNLVISRGINYGDGAEVPDVTGKNKNEAVTTLGKWIDIRIEEVQSDTVPEEEVISQSLEAGTLADPDQPITLTVSCGNRTPQSAETVQDTGSASVDSEQLEAEAAAAAAGEVWKCTQRLNVPEGYNGEQVKMELVQEVGGEVKTTTILEGETVSFPYQLDLTGAPGVSGGILYVYQINSEGNYYELGHYRITFDKVG